MKEEISRLLRDLPLVGATADQDGYRVKEGLKQLLQPSTIFESLGIKYAGLVDGHDEPALEEVLVCAKKLRKPVGCTSSPKRVTATDRRWTTMSTSCMASRPSTR